MISYIFSGFNSKEHFGKEVRKYFKKDMIKCESITFIPGEFEDIDKVKRYVATDVEWFKEININIKKVNILNDNMTKCDMKNIIENTDILFIMGGNTQKQNQFLEKYKLKKLIKETNAITIGISTGAINLAKKSLCSKDLDDGVEKTIVYNGIGRISYTFEPHFDKNNLNFLNEELYPLSNKIKIYGLPNETGIRISDNNYEIIMGDLYVIHKNEIKKL
jgi:peptidase E